MEWNEFEEETVDTVEEKEPERYDWIEAWEDPDLFDRLEEGGYIYEENEFGKHAYGRLTLGKGMRNLYAQRTVGGEDRQSDDHGGHLIATRFGGSGDLENLDAQHQNLNLAEYKRMENEWAKALENGDDVYADIQTYRSNGSQRPNAWMVNTITETETGREWDALSYANVGSAEQEDWELIVEEEDFRPEW